MEKFNEIIPFFGAFFGAFFGTFFGAFFGEQLFASKSEKFVQNPFCKRDPFFKKKKEEVKNTKKTPKKSFSVISPNFLFLGAGVQKLPFLTTWPRKRAPPKHYKNRGFSLF